MDEQIVETDELGGNHFARILILSLLATMGGANIKLLSALTGLPKKIVAQLLYELEDQNRVRLSVNGRVWKINEEATLQ